MVSPHSRGGGRECVIGQRVKRPFWRRRPLGARLDARNLRKRQNDSADHGQKHAKIEQRRCRQFDLADQRNVEIAERTGEERPAKQERASASGARDQNPAAQKDMRIDLLRRAAQP